MRIVLVAESASIDFGGEGALACHYFRVLLSRDVDVYLVTHERCKVFLDKYFPQVNNRIYYYKDNILYRFFYLYSVLPPRKINRMIGEFAWQLLAQLQRKHIIKNLITNCKETVIHEVMPVSPKQPYLRYNLNVPVIFGPLNGGMSYPKGFPQYQSIANSYINEAGRIISLLLNQVFRGKYSASAILVANERTRNALPVNSDPNAIIMPENGVDLSIWKKKFDKPKKVVPTFVYVGRLIKWKAVDILIEAFFKATQDMGEEINLYIIGDGEERVALEQLANRDSCGKIFFKGWMPQLEIAEILRECHALLLSSLYECGGAVVLEAMACSVPAVVTRWGGPVDYIDSNCGILVEPKSKEYMIQAFSNAMVYLIRHPEKAEEMGKNGRLKVENEYDWEKKVDKIMSIYQNSLQSAI